MRVGFCQTATGEDVFASVSEVADVFVDFNIGEATALKRLGVFRPRLMYSCCIWSLDNCCCLVRCGCFCCCHDAASSADAAAAAAAAAAADTADDSVDDDVATEVGDAEHTLSPQSLVQVYQLQGPPTLLKDLAAIHYRACMCACALGVA